MILRVFGVICLVTTLSTALAAQVKDLPAPSGPRPVGFRQMRWVDSTRAEPMTTALGDRRELVAFVWYPAASSPTGPRAPYFPDTALLSAALRQRYPTIAALKQHAVLDAAIEPGTGVFPVLLFSPGVGLSATFYATILEDLASYGYVVVGVEAPYEGMPVRLSDGRVAAAAEFTFADALTQSRNRADARSLDLLAVLRELERLNGRTSGSDFRQRLDLSRVGAFGHSRGGLAAGEACKREPRLRGCLNYDGVTLNAGVYPDTVAGVLTQPFMMVRRFRPEPTDSMLHEWKLTPEQWAVNRDSLEERARRVLRNQSTPSYLVTIDSATHLSFSDTPLLSTMAPVTAESIARQERLLGIVRLYTRGFFDRALRGVESAVLATPTPPVAIGSKPPLVQLEILPPLRR